MGAELLVPEQDQTIHVKLLYNLPPSSRREVNNITRDVKTFWKHCIVASLACIYYLSSAT